MMTNAIRKTGTWQVLLAIITLVYGLVYYELFLCKKIFMHDSLMYYGSFHYYIENIKKGIFPYWDPFMQMGTYFYPNISLYGLLDPFCLIGALASKIFEISPLTLFVYLRLYRLFIFVSGAFFLFRYFSKHTIASLLSSGILLFAVTPENLSQPMMDYCFTIPFALYFLMLFLDNINSRKRYLYLFLLVLISGITMNVFIPAAYLFSLVIFLILVLLLKIRNPREIARSLADKKMLVSIVLAVLLLAMMAAPPVSVKLRDASISGELFPVGRLIDATSHTFKKMMASELREDIFSEAFTQKRGVFISYGNLVNLLYPDISNMDYWAKKRYLSAASLYFGIIPLLVCIIGLSSLRSKYKPLIIIMFLLTFISAFSHTGLVSPYNPLQKILNTLFPPLSMIDTRINLGSLIFFYICLFLSVTMGFLLREDNLEKMIRLKYRRIMTLCAGILLLKAAITAYFAEKLLFISAYDLFVLMLVGFFALLILSFRKGMISRGLFLTSLFLLIFADLGYYNVYAARSVMVSSRPYYDFLNTKSDYRDWSIMELNRARQWFEYFRLPFEEYAPLPAFGETMIETKGAVIGGTLSSLFTTRRYYDMFSILSMEKQLAINGLLFPIVRFYPENMVANATDKRSLLNYLEDSDIDKIGRLAVLEKPGTINRPFKITSLDQYEDVTWFGTDEGIFLYNRYEPFMFAIRKNLQSFLASEDFSIQVVRFSINEIAIEVKNRVDGYLYYNDGWSRYWKAFDSNREIPVLIANYNSKAVFLAAGKHLIRFVFSPGHYKIALALYYAGLVLSLALAGLSWHYSRGTLK
ncbi:MAG: hypothetical protein HZA17_09985 [Nitrospirae bacterium]|nr:hypothetical protein [Nitrospirota bacterium]